MAISAGDVYSVEGTPQKVPGGGGGDISLSRDVFTV